MDFALKRIETMYCFLSEKMFAPFYHTICDFSKKKSQNLDVLGEKNTEKIGFTKNFIFN